MWPATVRQLLPHGVVELVWDEKPPTMSHEPVDNVQIPRVIQPPPGAARHHKHASAAPYQVKSNKQFKRLSKAMSTELQRLNNDCAVEDHRASIWVPCSVADILHVARAPLYSTERFRTTERNGRWHIGLAA
jgi:hypothetical protein